MLTIGQLAAHAGVTVRAVRHYHQRGLLPEPAPDASGYRRYDAQAVVDLIRIRTLADAGVPLARVEELLGAGPAEFARAVTEIDAALRRKIDELTEHRRRIAGLAAGDRAFLPDGVIGLLDLLRAIGISERQIRVERDAWILLSALSPRSVPEWAATKKELLADPESQGVYLALDEAFDWPPNDPRLPGLADRITAWLSRFDPGDDGDRPAELGLVDALIDSSSPGIRRLYTLLRDRRAEKA
ncbi:MerR family transcriptional regulator [Nocardiopsis sp. RSe5-2]|uniref:MerR family transcriptional regulator n=1 Tax=Nocardiopsis endophytica TaxID=3018445 RepID=A0ABT4U3I1_9ACTN|nr:MerR family transcriptional regulator [Nocardiopsis endophytica]MDA2811517.1 MerR family transcriptional regulator [Nocardiopsis endophytica]